MNKTILVTGSNSGFGKLIVEQFASNGWQVAATMRDISKAGSLTEFPNVNTYQLDVTNADSVARAKSVVLQDFGKIDIVVNNAGFGVYGAFELSTEEEVERQFAVNVKGLMAVTKAWLPHFRENQGGMFINISSVAGINSYPLASLYVASKWAVEGFSESLYYEVKPFNIKLKLIEPGGFKTNFQTSSITWTQNPAIDVYDKKLARTKKFRNDRQENLPDPIEVAKLAFRAATDGTDRLRYLIGKDAEKMMNLRESLGAEKFVERQYEEYMT